MYVNMPYGIQIANTRFSHGKMVYDYSDYNEKTFNFAMTSQSLEYDVRLIEYYIDYFTKDSVLLITVSYFSLWDDELTDLSFDSKNLRYFAVLDRKYMRFNRESPDHCLQKYFPSLVFLIIKWVIYLMVVLRTNK